MKKPLRWRSAAGLIGGSICLLTFPLAGRAQSARPPASTLAANTEPGAVNAEVPGAEETPLPSNDTEILANQGATFAAKDRIAVFFGDVRVKDPRFNLACDKLTVYLAKAAPPAASPAPTPAPAMTPPPIEPAAKPGDKTPTADADRGGGIDHAVAEGHVIIIKKNPPAKPGEEEKVSIGRGDTAEFDNKTGDMTLRGMPRVEQNGDSHEALSRSTFMILHKDNSLETHGPSRTFIMPRSNNTLPGSTPGTKPGSNPPAVSPGGRHPSTSGTQN